MNGSIGAECQYIVKQKPGIKAGAVDNLNRRLGRAIFYQRLCSFYRIAKEIRGIGTNTLG